MDDNHRPYTFHFYQLAPPNAEDALRVLFDGHIEKDINIPPAINGDHYIQVQDLLPHNETLGNLVSGVVKKFHEKDIPKIGKKGESNERSIDMDEGEALIEKTYFLYSFTHHVLLYQTNVRGTSYNQFSRYLKTARLGNASFEPLLTHNAYTMLINDESLMKNLEFTISTPTNPEMLKGQGDNLEDGVTSLLEATGASSIKVIIKAGRGDKTLASRAKDLTLSLMRKFDSDKGKTSNLSGNVDLIDEQDVSHSLDLFANRISAKVDIPMDGRYPKKDAILTHMKRILDENSEEIREIVGL